LGVLAMALQDIIGAAEVSENANRWFALLAEGFDDAIVADAVRLIGLKGGH
jgi:hypothetical protein